MQPHAKQHADHEQTTTVGHFINGKTVLSDREPSIDVYNPATGAKSREVCIADAELVEICVSAAKEAFQEWRLVTPAKRARIMFEFKALLERNADEIAALIVQEHGKVFDDAMGEFRRGLEIVEYACGAPELLKGQYAKSVGPGIDSWSEHQALGVVAGITPFNFPAMVPMWMFPIAIACGNSFILKPSEKAPSAPTLIAKLFSDAGLPDGVFNILHGNQPTVEALIDHQDIQAVSFVGSTPVAQAIYERGAKRGKRVQALGGAKNHAIVMPDADIQNATNALIGAAYGSCGERCMAISVAVCVGDETGDKIVAGLEKRIDELRVGSGMTPGIEMGPLVTKEHLDKVEKYIEIGLSEGAELIVDGRGIEVQEPHNEGYFLGPCLFDNVRSNMRIYQDEIFGPVLCVVRVQTQEEAMDLINAHEFGNGTCIFTRDGEAARYFSDNIHVGMVGVNVALPVPAPTHSFGGWKRSLFGDLYAYGPDGVRFYTRRKTVTQRWPSQSVREKANLAFPS